MKRVTFVAVVAIAALGALSGCSATNDSRTGLRGEICAFGYCLSPQAMAASAVAVPQTTIMSGEVVAPATVLSQPALATAQVQRTTYVQAAPAMAPPPVSYGVASPPPLQLAK